jgi:integrase
MGPADSVRFAHNAERQLADLLDSYGVRWAYEPRTFVLDRHPDGRPRWAFTPDFHLPDFDLYIELTTLRQALVTRKNAKVRRLRELHPEINVKVLYARDYEHLGARFGLEPAEQVSAAG